MFTPTTRPRFRPNPPAIRVERLEDRLAPAIIFTETFDTTAVGALPTGWTQTTALGTTPNWGVDTTLAPNPLFDGASGKSVRVDDPSSVADKRLTSPAIAMPAVDGLQLRFRHNYGFETNWDGGVLEVAIPGVAGGAFQDILTAGGKFAQGGYTHTINTSGNPIAGRGAWSASSGGAFVTSLVNLPAAAGGKNVQFRWRMGSDESVAGTGWRVDNVQVGTPSLFLESGNNQSVRITTGFAAPLAVRVVGGFGGPVAGLTVTFSGPPTVTFPSGTTAVTDATGVASVPVAAGGTAGPVQVTAAIPGVGGVTFDLTITPNQLPTNVTAGGPYLTTPGGSISIAASATDPEGDFILYSWDLNGDGTFGDAVGPLATLTPAALSALGIVGGFTTANARVRATDTFGGATDSPPTTVSVVVPPAPPPPPARLTAVGAAAGGAPHVKVFNADGSERFSFFAFDPQFAGGVSVATGDVTGDRLEDVVVAAGAGGGPHVRVFDGATGQLVREFFAFDGTFRGGVNVAVGDVNNDGFWDIVTAAGAGGGPHVRVFSGQPGAALLRNFFAYGGSFTGGVSVAAADVDGDQRADVVTAAGAGGAPHVKVFSGANGAEIRSFFAFDPTFRGGVNVAAGDIDRDGRAELFLGQASGGSRVSAVSGANGGELFNGELFGGDGVSVAVAELDGRGLGLVAGSGAGRPSAVRLLRLDGTAAKEFAPFGPFAGGVNFG